VRRRIDKGFVWTGLDAQKRFEEKYTQDQRKSLIHTNIRQPVRELSFRAEKTYEAHYKFAAQCDWDTEFAFNMDNRKRGFEGGFGTDENAANWAESQVLIFFRDLDRKVFGKASTRHGLRTNRFVVLERAEGVGWHAHGLIKLNNTRISQEMMAEEWRRHQMMRMGENEFSKRLALVRNVWEDAVWHYNEFSEPVLSYSNSSIHYILKKSYFGEEYFRISNATYLENMSL